MHALILEDDTEWVEEIGTILQNYGVTYTHVKRADDAIKLLQRNLFQIVTIDIDLSSAGGSFTEGKEVVRWLTDNGMVPVVECLVISGTAQIQAALSAVWFSFQDAGTMENGKKILDVWTFYKDSNRKDLRIKVKNRIRLITQGLRSGLDSAILFNNPAVKTLSQNLIARFVTSDADWILAEDHWFRTLLKGERDVAIARLQQEIIFLLCQTFATVSSLDIELRNEKYGGTSWNTLAVSFHENPTQKRLVYIKIDFRAAIQLDENLQSSSPGRFVTKHLSVLLGSFTETAQFQIPHEDTVYTSELQHAVAAARAVARVTVPRIRNGVTSDAVNGTGWLIAPGLLLTCLHVVQARDRMDFEPCSKIDFELQIQATVVTFDYTAVSTGIAYHVEHLETVPTQNRTLDYALLRLKDRTDAPLSKRPILGYELSPVLTNRSVLYIIQHPLGQLQQVAYHRFERLSADKASLIYRTATEYGSSGAPVFNKETWKVVAIHRGEIRTNDDLREGILLGPIMEEIQVSRPELYQEIITTR